MNGYTCLMAAKVQVAWACLAYVKNVNRHIYDNLCVLCIYIYVYISFSCLHLYAFTQVLQFSCIFTESFFYGNFLSHGGSPVVTMVSPFVPWRNGNLRGHEFRWTRPLDEALAIRQVRKTQVVEAPSTDVPGNEAAETTGWGWKSSFLKDFIMFFIWKWDVFDHIWPSKNGISTPTGI